MKNGKIPVSTYRAYAKNFNPAKYDPTSWAALAKEAGMRYMVITSKYHDGFSLFPSEASDWDIADASPHAKPLDSGTSSILR
jgi:alpha-L-fucosidase